MEDEGQRLCGTLWNFMERGRSAEGDESGSEVLCGALWNEAGGWRREDRGSVGLCRTLWSKAGRWRMKGKNSVGLCRTLRKKPQGRPVKKGGAG